MTSGTGLPGRAQLPTRHPGDRASFTDPAPPAWFRARAGPNSNGAARMSGPMIDISDKCNPRLQPRSSRRLRHDHDEAEWEYAARAGTQTAISGATRSARRTPIVMGVAAGGMVSRPHRSAHSSLMRSASTIWPATCSSGCRIATTTITTGRPRAARRGQQVIAPSVSSAAVPGSSILSPSARPTASSADSEGSRPRIRDDVARQSDLMSLGVPR